MVHEQGRLKGLKNICKYAGWSEKIVREEIENNGFPAILEHGIWVSYSDVIDGWQRDNYTKKISSSSETDNRSEEDGFIQGVIWSAGFIASDHGDDVKAADIISHSGISIHSAANVCCEYDLARARKAVKDLPMGRI